MKKPNIDEVVAACALAALAAAGLAASCNAHAGEEVTIGAHLVSTHIPAQSYQNNFNPGFYLRMNSGLTIGAYYNTLKRSSYYLAWTTPEFAYMSVTMGVVSGYQKKLVHVETTKTPCDPESSGCYHLHTTGTWEGSSSGAVTLMLAPSVRLPQVLGITPRVSVIPRFGAASSTVVHLSIERQM
jgi:hypothetical protein